MSRSVALSTDRPSLFVSATLALVMSLIVPLAGHAQDESFDERVAEARATAQARFDEIFARLDDAVGTMADEAYLMGPLAENLVTTEAILREFADTLEALEVPPSAAEDVARHVSALRELAASTSATAAAAAAGDRTGVESGTDAVAQALAALAGELDPAYAAHAFVSPLDYDFLGAFGSLGDEDRAYLVGVQDATDEWDRRLLAFQEILGGQYPSAEALLAALYEAGAGEAWAAVEAKARQLTPTARFEDEHTWWLDRLAVQAEVDGRIGDAMRDGDITAFVTDNIRLGLLPSPYPGLDPAFGAAAQPGSPLSTRLDPAVLSQGDAGYLQGLFDALRGPGSADIFDGIRTALIDLPGTTDEIGMAAVAATGAELMTAFGDLEAAVSGLQPSAVHAADHALITDYLSASQELLAEIVEASAASDADIVFDAYDEWNERYCATAAELSDTIEPVTSVYFNAGAPSCRE